MKKRLSFIAFLSLLSLNYLHSPLNAAGTDAGETQEVCGPAQNPDNQIDLSVVEAENQEDLTPYIKFSNETYEGKEVLVSLLHGRAIPKELGYIYHIEQTENSKELTLLLKDLIGAKDAEIELIFNGNKKNNDPNDNKGNASVSAEYQIVLQGDILEDVILSLNISKFKPLFTNKKTPFASSIQHICDGTFWHEGKRYAFFDSSNQDAFRILTRWEKPSFELTITPFLRSVNSFTITNSTLKINDVKIKEYHFKVFNK